ncbi:dTDP-4-dehydrorhamnose 3,5-epimerase [Alphaproteobacteria bacterium]|nr:dTDP-4-dehydrorhamnose 3,5-epimerase [Alphaproteobacteria bacterium]
MNVAKTKLLGVLIFEPSIFRDSRGYFKETFQKERYEKFGLSLNFVQDNFSRSQRGVLRGLHFQINKPQGKLVSCLRGAIYDVAVDINSSSKTFGQYVGVELTEDNHKQLWIPPGYAHGFCVLSKTADFQYKCTDFYNPSDERGIIWNDPFLKIDWPINKPYLSSKDSTLPKISEMKSETS